MMCCLCKKQKTWPISFEATMFYVCLIIYLSHSLVYFSCYLRWQTRKLLDRAHQTIWGNHGDWDAEPQGWIKQMWQGSEIDAWDHLYQGLKSQDNHELSSTSPNSYTCANINFCCPTIDGKCVNRDQNNVN